MRIVILTYASAQSVRIVEKVLSSPSAEIISIVYSTAIIPGRDFLGSLYFLAKTTAPSFLFYRGMEALVTKPHERLSRLAQEYNVPLIGVQNINSPESVELLQEQKPDLILSAYFSQILKSDVIRVPTIGVINSHPSVLPSYRGLFPNFWVLANGDDMTGASIHWIDDGQIDVGDVIVQKRVPVTDDDTVTSLSFRTAEACGEALTDVIDALKRNEAVRKTQEGGEPSYFSWPKRSDMWRLRKQGRKFWSLGELLAERKAQRQ